MIQLLISLWIEAYNIDCAIYACEIVSSHEVKIDSGRGDFTEESDNSLIIRVW